MEVTLEKIKEILKMKNIHLSYQRMKVLEYLVHHLCHPSADQIYVELKKEIPSLSKTTIYSTLKILEDANVIRSLTIDDNEVRYDIETYSHGHFICEKCGKIFNFETDINKLPYKNLDNFQIDDKEIFFKGICPECLKKTK